VLKPDVRVTLKAAESSPVRLVILGGEPRPRYIAWNFVSSSRERIEQAKGDWHNQNFPRVPGETEFIPLPD
jgi:redox-sensitive bicupin YhaK (pirin superfamily)